MPALPTRPSLRHLKNEAKDLRKALAADDAEAVARVRQHLPSLDRGEKSPGEVSLQEVQHAIAQEYGHKTWADLLDAVELDFASLALLSDRDVQFILTKIDQKDLVIALKEAETEAMAAVRRRIVECVSENVRTFLTEEMEYLGPMPASEIEEVRQRIYRHVRQMGEAGSIAWPPGSDGGPASSPPPPEMPATLELVRRPLEELSIDEVRTLCRGLCAMARSSGILSLGTVADESASPFIAEAVRLAVDGTEPDLIADLMKSRREGLVRHLRIRMQMILEGTVATQAGDNPRLIAHKLHAMYSIDYGVKYRNEEGTVAQFRARVAAQPVSEMDLDELTMTICDLAVLARREGIQAIAPLLEVIDDELLRDGLEMVVDRAEMAQVVERMEERIGEVTGVADLRYRLLAEGIATIQRGVEPAALGEVLDRVQADA